MSETGAWKKSTRSGANGCVEVSFTTMSVGVRDSKDPAGPEFFVHPGAWQNFVRALTSNSLKD